MQAAIGVSAVCGYKLVVSDMVYSLEELGKLVHSLNPETFYIAIREMGTESGNMEHCLERCKCLGYPIVIAKVEKDSLTDYNMTVMFTHNWMSGDNNYMEQEFSSL